MEHPGTGHSVDTGPAFSIPALLLGPFWFFAKGLVWPGVAAGALVILTFGFGWLALPFLFPVFYEKSLAKQGYVRIESAYDRAERTGTKPPTAEENAAAAQAMMRDVASIPVDPGLCMVCGSRTGVSGQAIGFSRVIGKTSEFTGGKFKWTTSASVVKTQMILCETCWKPRKNFVGLLKVQPGDFARHPWWAAAQKHGFVTNLNTFEVERYRSA